MVPVRFLGQESVIFMREEERKRNGADLEDAVKMEVGAVVVDPWSKVAVAVLVVEAY